MLTCTYVYTYVCTYVCTYAHSCMSAHVHTCRDADVRTNTHTHDLLARALHESCVSPRELICIRIYTYIRTYVYDIFTCIRTFRHTDIRQICLRELPARELARALCASPLREQHPLRELLARELAQGKCFLSICFYNV